MTVRTHYRSDRTRLGRCTMLFFACRKPTGSTEPERVCQDGFSALTQSCWLSMHNSSAGELCKKKSHHSRSENVLGFFFPSFFKIPGQSFAAVSSGVALYLCPHLWFDFILLDPVSESAQDVPRRNKKKTLRLHPEPQWMH